MLRSSCLASVADVPADTWSDLVAGAGGSPFYSSGFLRAFEVRPLGRTESMHFVGVEGKGGELVAGVPVFVQPNLLAAPALADLPSTGLVTHGWHCYDTLVPRHASVTAVSAVRCIVDAMRAQARSAGVDWFGFINVAAHSAVGSALDSLGFTTAPLARRFVLDLTRFADHQEYLASLTHRARHELTRQCRKARESGISIRRHPASEVADISGLTAIRSTVDKHDSRAYLSVDSLLHLVARLPSEAGIAIIVSLGDEELAAGIILHAPPTLHAWVGGYLRRDDLPFSPYYVLFDETVRLGFDTSSRTIELGRSNDSFKRRFGLSPIDLNAHVAMTTDGGAP